MIRADITLLYHSVDNAKEAYLNCNILNLNKQKGVLSIEPNHGNAKNRNIFMDTYIMKKDLFMDLIHKARAISSAFTLTDIINELHNDLDVREFPIVVSSLPSQISRATTIQYGSDRYQNCTDTV